MADPAGAPAAESPRPAVGARSSGYRDAGLRSDRRPALLRGVLLAALGAASGVSALTEGFYDLTTWGPIAIGIFALALGLIVAGIGRPRVVPALAVGGLVALWLWSWLSTTWAESADQALEESGRWALYAALLLALVLLMKRRRERWLPLALAAGGVVAVGGTVAVEMAYGDGAGLFFGGRLRDPLGYVNGQAGYFLLGFWPCVAAAEQGRHKWLAGLGAAGAILVASLLILSQARGVLPGLAVSAAIVLLLVPGRARRVLVVAALGIVLATIAAPLLDVYQSASAGGVTDPAVISKAGKLVLLAAFLLGIAWWAIGMLLSRTALGSGGSPRRGVVVAERVLAAAVVVAGLGAFAIAVGNPAERLDREFDSFVNLRVESPTDTRFLSGGGYRYDYWRVAWLEFKEKPVRGVGAGNYDRRYFAERRTSEDIRQPHSLPLQTMAELGVVGLLGLLAFVGAVFAGLWRTSRAGRDSTTSRMLAVAGGGAFTAWLVHTGVDWLHLLPGVTGVALCAAAGVIAPWSRHPPGRALGARRIVTTLFAAAAVLAAADLVGRIAAADHHRIEGRDKLRSDPIDSIRHANQALAFNRHSVPALIIKSAGYARLNDYRRARAVLLEAAELEPHDPVPWMLLGDLAARRHEFARAREAYERALALNPRDPHVAVLARDPESVAPRP